MKITTFSLNYNQTVSLCVVSYSRIKYYHLTNSNINFMDGNINIQPYKTLIFNIYDKITDFLFNVINSININSCLHISAYRKLLNHCIPIEVLCSFHHITPNLINFLKK